MLLTKKKESNIITKLSKNGGKKSARTEIRNEKIFEKNLKKVLTKRKRFDIIIKLSR